jgi:two-component system response regulator AtoC
MQCERALSCRPDLLVPRLEVNMVAYKRILVVDPDSAVLFIFSEVLRALGKTNQIVTASDGPKALKEFRRKAFDLVVTGLKMPHMSGVQLTEAIKAVKPDTPVIWITAHGSHNFASDAERLGVISCHDKPLEISQILQLAKDALIGDKPA